MHEVDFIPVGEAGRHGQAVALRFTRPDNGSLAHVVIDAGFQASGDAMVTHFDKWYGTRNVDLAILTHPDGDHIGGMGHVLRELNVAKLWLHRIGARGGSDLPASAAVEDLIAVAQREGTTVYEAFDGASEFGGALRIVGPTEKWYDELVAAQVEEARSGPPGGLIQKAVKKMVRRFKDMLPEEMPFDDAGGTNPRNNSSMITLVEVEGVRMFFPSDGGVPAIERAWQRVIDVTGDSRAPDFVEMPHHGSRKNGSSALFDWIFGPVGQPQTKTVYVNVAPEAEKHPSARIANAFMRRGYKVGETKGKQIRMYGGGAPDREGVGAHYAHGAAGRIAGGRIGIFDAYVLRARFAPAVLASLPALAMLGAGIFSTSQAIRLSGILLGGVGLLACGVVRDRGRSLQPALWDSWGGSPTVQRLRWRGAADEQRVERLHSRVAAATSHALPDSAQEMAEPAAADCAYEDAIEVLRNRTRDRNQFSLVFEENMEYGFRRNLLGLRPFGMAIATVGLCASAILLVASSPDVRWTRWGFSLAVAAVAVAGWWKVVTPEWVRRAAETYADRLLEAADSLQQGT